MKHINQAGLNLIKYFESYKQFPYICPAGYLTIGYGHVIKPNETFENGISPEAAEALLKEDVENAECAVIRLIVVPLTDNQFSALVSFTFNLGGGALQRSTLRMKINRK